jgi:hypothetical protein
MHFAASPFGRGVVGLAAGLLVFGCKAKAKPSAAPVAPSASASSKEVSEPVPEHCRTLGSGASLIVGEVDRPAREPGAEPSSDDGDDEEALQPFATRVDSALALGDTFVVGGLNTHRGVTDAFVAFVPLDGSTGRRVGLGSVHGDVDPPIVAGQVNSVLAAVADMDAGGGMLRVTKVELEADKPHGELSITGVEHDAGAALAAGDQGALLVWGARGKHGVALRALGIDPEKLTGTAQGDELKGTNDAESPVLVARPGGYWLAWVSEQAPSSVHADGGSHDVLARDAGPREPTTRDGGSSAGDEPLVDVGPRALMVLALDAKGKATGVPRAVSGGRSHVVGFSAALLPDAALSLTWREDDAAPGVESGPPELARVGLDGAVQRAKVDDEELSVGSPSLLADPKPSGDVWVALESANEGTRVGILSPSGLKLDALVGDRLLRGADLLAAGDKKLLVSRSRGRAVELGVLECKPQP